MITYKVNKGFIVQKLGYKTVIFDGERSELYTFNSTSSYIFKSIKLGFSEKEIIEKLVRRYDIKEEQAKKDFNELVSDLQNKKIIALEKPKALNK